MRMRKAALFLSFAVVFSLMGCDDAPPKDVKAPQDETVTETPSVENDPVPADAMPKITDIKKGSGEKVEKGDHVWVLYKGALTDGTKFDSNMDPDKTPWYVHIGDGNAIPGFERGIIGMQVGGERKSEVPALLGYGKRGNPPLIKPNADLVFDIKLLHIVKKGHEREYGAKDLVVGKGEPCKKGDKVKVQYTGTLLNGLEFDSSRKTNVPLEVTLGAGAVIQGWDDGLVGMRVGGRRKLVIPPDLGYGPNAKGDKLPPNSVLVFDVELVEIVK